MMDPEPPARTYLKVSIRFNQVLRAPPNQSSDVERDECNGLSYIPKIANSETLAVLIGDETRVRRD